MKRERIESSNAPAPIGPYCQAVRAGDMLFLSGQIPIDPASGEMVADNITAQTERVLTNLQAVLEEAGATFADVVKTSVYLADMSHFAEMNAVYAKYFAHATAARAAVQVAALPKGALLEIDAIAALSD